MDSFNPNCCILLVAPEITSMEKTLFVLLDAKYRVSIAYNAKDALDMVQKRERKINLVLTESKLPDMSSLLFLDILNAELGMPVVVLLDFYHIPMTIEFLKIGAKFCLAKPLSPHYARNLWQHGLLFPPLKTIDESSDEECDMLEEEEILSHGTPFEPFRPFTNPFVTMEYISEKLEILRGTPTTNVAWHSTLNYGSTLAVDPPFPLPLGMNMRENGNQYPVMPPFPLPLGMNMRDNGNQYPIMPPLFPYCGPTPQGGGGASTSRGVETYKDVLLRGQKYIPDS